MADHREDEHAEARANRPYRRLVGVVFAVAVVALCSVVLRGVVRALDRLPSAATLDRPAEVDVRALRACAEDLDKLEAKIRQAAGRAFAAAPDAPDEWHAAQDALELERITLVARCRLDEPSEDPVVHDLERAAEGLESLLRRYNLLYARHKDDGRARSREAREALERATHALRTR